MARMSSYPVECHGAIISMMEHDEPTTTTFRVVTHARGDFEANRSSVSACGYITRHHVASEHDDVAGAVQACRIFCAVFSAEAWIEQELVWGDETASHEETETICHLAFDEDTGLVVNA